jgi:hypothetical protein
MGISTIMSFPKETVLLGQQKEKQDHYQDHYIEEEEEGVKQGNQWLIFLGESE